MEGQLHGTPSRLSTSGPKSIAFGPCDATEMACSSRTPISLDQVQRWTINNRRSTVQTGILAREAGKDEPLVITRPLSQRSVCIKFGHILQNARHFGMFKQEQGRSCLLVSRLFSIRRVGRDWDGDEHFRLCPLTPLPLHHTTNQPAWGVRRELPHPASRGSIRPHINIGEKSWGTIPCTLKGSSRHQSMALQTRQLHSDLGSLITTNKLVPGVTPTLQKRQSPIPALCRHVFTAVSTSA